MVFELTARLKIPFEKQNFTMYDIAQAEKFLLGSSAGCALPVREVDGILAKASVPGYMI